MIDVNQLYILGVWLWSYIPWVLLLSLIGWIVINIRPDFIAIISLLLKKSPTSQFDIQRLINSFFNGTDWKYIEAEKRLKNILKKRVRELEEYKENEWNDLKDKVEYIPLDDLDLMYYESEKELEQLEAEGTNRVIKDEAIIKNMKKYENEIQTLHKKYPYARRIGWKEMPFKPIKSDHVVEFGVLKDRVFTTEQMALYGTKLLDIDGSITKEEFMSISKLYPYKKGNDKQIEKLFNDMMSYIDKHDSKDPTRETLIKNFALGLSKNEESNHYLEDFINDVETDAVYL